MALQAGKLDLASGFFEGIPPPTLAGLDGDYGGGGMRRSSGQILKHAAVTAWLGKPFIAGVGPDFSTFCHLPKAGGKLRPLAGRGARWPLTVH